MSLYYSPVFYGLNDVTIPEPGGSFKARIYYPSEEEEVRDVAIRDGIYPLIAFAHGDRSSEPGLCPEDATEDYKRWGAVLHLLARCGFVVVSVAVHDVLSDQTRTAERIETAVRWARAGWAHRRVLHQPPVIYLDPDVMAAPARSGKQQERAASVLASKLGRGVVFDDRVFLGAPTPLALVGHSWGARGAAVAAIRGQVAARVIASIAGSWDSNESIAGVVNAGLPTLMVVGSDDFLNASYLAGLWNSLAEPKHQAMIQGLGHWDWFGTLGGIQPCNESAPRPGCPAGWQAASELLLGFVTKYLLNHWWRPSYLLGSPGGRPPFLHWFDSNGPCAIKIRWNDPTFATNQVSGVTLGNWTSPAPW